MKRAALALLLLCGAAALALDWREVAAVRIPAGEVASVAVDGETVWKRVPYDAEIEYLESTGTQWIDTGYVPTHETEFNLRFSPNVLTDGSIKPVHGNAYSTKNYRSADQAPVTLWHSNGTNNRFFYSPVMFSNWAVGETFDVRQGAAGLWINGSKIGEYSSLRTPPNEPMWLFRYYNGVNEQFGKFKLFYWKAWQNGTLVRDFTPVRVGLTGYLYDRVSGQLYGNAGTGAFVLGPDKE